MAGELGWYIAGAAMSGIVIMPLLILWAIALCTVRRRGDPARTAFRWMKVAMPFEILYDARLPCQATDRDARTPS